MCTDWKVYLIGERPESGKWVPHGAELVWRGSGELDLALLRLTDAPSLTPRQRVMFASWGVVGSIDVVEAVGFPEAWSTSAIPTRDYALSGRLRISTQRGPYAWTVAPGDRPDSRDGWKGMSGGTVCKIGPDGLHIFGVLEAVPANFSSGQLSVARLSFAFADILFWNELRTSLGREPRLVPWNGEFTSTQARFYSTIPTLNNRPFVGREDLLEGIGAALRDPSKEAVVVLRGPAGVGKSELAQEFARRNQQAYPGGTFYLDGGSPLLAMELAKLGQTALKLDFPEELKIDAQGEWTLQHLAASAPTLLIYDNVQSETAIEAWLPRAGMACHVVITTLLDRWEVGWVAFDVTPLSRQDSINLIERTVGSSLANRYGTRLTDVAGGLPVQIIPRCSTLAHEEKRGRGGAASLALLDPKAKSSFSGVYQLLSASARLLLHAAARLSPQRIPSDELRSHMVKGVGWSEGEFADYLDACLDFYTLQGVSELRMHQLFAKFVLDIQASDAVATPLAAIVQTQLARMVEVAQELAAHPNRADLAALLMVFLPNPEHWDQGDAKVSVADGEVVGCALLGIGVFEAALPWFERAVAAKEQGDVHGRVDQESLGTSLHYVGYCLSSTGQFEAALPWFERAVAASEHGDVHSRVDQESLSASLHQVGHCLSSTGQFEAALPWFERAVAASEQGDVHGRVDHASLGNSLHLVGYCLSSTGQFEATLSLFERAVAAKEQGDVHGRVDHASLGTSLNQVGHCLASTGQFEAALPWFERAVAAKEQGDVHGRVDHASLGTSLSQVGYCLSRTGQFEAALPWFERAVAAKEQGDVHGRVDRTSIAASLRAGADCLAQLGRHAEATDWEKRVSSSTP